MDQQVEPHNLDCVSSNAPEWNVTPLKTKMETVDPTTSFIKRKDTRRFCDKWYDIFAPWLSRCAEDPDKPFCRACQRKLDNNRFRLQRHERTAKHNRNLEILLNSGEMAVIEYLSQRKKRRRRCNAGDSKIKMETSMTHFFHTPAIESTHFESKFTPNKHLIPKNETYNFSTPRTPIENIDLDLYYRSLERDRRDMNMSESYYGTPQPNKDCFDMFFHALSASVKNLPPKLGAEVKSRVSQVVAEYELRAICQQEDQENVNQSIASTQEGNITVDSVLNEVSNQKSSNDGTVVTQYVYSYQPKY